MARQFKGGRPGGEPQENDYGFNEMYKNNKEEIDKFLDELYEEQQRDEELLKYSDADIEEAIGNAIANGDEELKRIKIQQETDLVNEALDNVDCDEFQKGILRGIIKQDIEDRASFVGEKRDEEKYQRYERMETAIRLFASTSGLAEDAVYISRPSRNQSYGMVRIEVPDIFSVTPTNRFFPAELIRLADETTFSVGKNLDGTPVEPLSIGMAFTIYDIWS